MADESTSLILADAGAAALGEPPKARRLFGRKRSTTLPAAALTHCENCGAALAGIYCGQCGQHAIDYRRSLLRVMVDAADSFFNWDTKFLKSVGVLLVRPGKLTNDFNSGRRVRYVHPLRLYLLASIAFFLVAKLANFTPNGRISLSPEDRAEVNGVLAKLSALDSPLTAEERSKVEEVRSEFAHPAESVSAEHRARIDKAALRLPAFIRKKALKSKDRAKLDAILASALNPMSSPSPNDAAIPANGIPAPPEITAPPGDRAKGVPLLQFDSDDESKSPFGVWLKARVKKKFGEDGTNAQLFLDTLRSNLPTMMLCCVPLFAFVLKLLYFRQRRFYVEHLVYALHIHTFVYVTVVLITLLGLAAQRWVPSIQVLLTVALSFVVVAQVFVSIRRVYRQGWFMTILKFLLGGVAYCSVLSLALGTTAFILLLLP